MPISRPSMFCSRRRKSEGWKWSSRIKFTARLAEPPIAVDPTSDQQKEQLPTYNAYSGDGDVTGPLVYVNYGRREDYDAAGERMGVSVKGAIVIVRYGKNWRGIKPKVAAEHGAIGCLIYSDPATGWLRRCRPLSRRVAGRTSESVQRGGVNDTDFPGDPLTPEISQLPRTPNAWRSRILRSSPRFPSCPSPMEMRSPCWQRWAGRWFQRSGAAGLPITYHAGPGPAKVHLKMFSNWDIQAGVRRDCDHSRQ